MATRSRRAALARKAERTPIADLSEAAFQAWVQEKAEAAGWVLQFHVRRTQGRDGRWITNTSSSGVPDLWLLRPATGQLVVLELKRRGGHPTDEQRAWIAGLQQVPGVEAYIVDPTHADEVLALLAMPRP